MKGLESCRLDCVLSPEKEGMRKRAGERERERVKLGVIVMHCKGTYLLYVVVVTFKSMMIYNT